jgi:hypothetical protein
MNRRANPHCVAEQAAATARALRGRTSTITRTGEASGRIVQPGIDHDDLLSLLDWPRPAHGDLQVLLRRRSDTASEAEGKT